MDSSIETTPRANTRMKAAKADAKRAAAAERHAARDARKGREEEAIATGFTQMVAALVGDEAIAEHGVVASPSELSGEAEVASGAWVSVSAGAGLGDAAVVGNAAERSGAPGGANAAPVHLASRAAKGVALSANGVVDSADSVPGAVLASDAADGDAEAPGVAKGGTRPQDSGREAPREGGSATTNNATSVADAKGDGTSERTGPAGARAEAPPPQAAVTSNKTAASPPAETHPASNALADGAAQKLAAAPQGAAPSQASNEPPSIDVAKSALDASRTAPEGPQDAPDAPDIMADERGSADAAPGERTIASRAIAEPQSASRLLAKLRDAVPGAEVRMTERSGETFVELDHPELGKLELQFGFRDATMEVDAIVENFTSATALRDSESSLQREVSRHGVALELRVDRRTDDQAGGRRRRTREGLDLEA